MSRLKDFRLNKFSIVGNIEGLFVIFTKEKGRKKHGTISEMCVRVP